MDSECVGRKPKTETAFDGRRKKKEGPRDTSRIWENLVERGYEKLLFLEGTKGAVFGSQEKGEFERFRAGNKGKNEEKAESIPNFGLQSSPIDDERPTKKVTTYQRGGGHLNGQKRCRGIDRGECLLVTFHPVWGKNAKKGASTGKGGLD